MKGFNALKQPQYIARILIYILVFAVSGQSSALAQNGTPTTPSPQINIHVVQPGETLQTIALSYGIDPSTLGVINGLENSGEVSIGQHLVIPMMPQQSTTIVVQPGETLDVLAARYMTHPQSIAMAHGLTNPETLFAGQSIAIASPNKNGFGLIMLQTNDDLWRISFRLNMNPYQLFLLNRLTNLYVHSPGKILAVPDEKGTHTPFRDPWHSIIIHPLPFEGGRTGGIVVTTSSKGTLTGLLLDRSVRFVSSDGLRHEAVYGVDRWIQPGIYKLSLTFTSSEGIVTSYVWPLRALQGNYASETIKLSEDEASALSNPSSVQSEYSYIASTMSGFSPVRHWNNLFTLPTEGVLTSAFGTMRLYQNTTLTTFHTGSDLATSIGTEIRAPADGIVADTGLLDIRGYVTILDHGAGVYTGYWHQSAITIKPGDIVSVGQVIGRVGNTGLSTASHLHWEMWVGGTPVDPMQWVREIFP